MAELFIARTEISDGVPTVETLSPINSANNMYVEQGAVMSLFNRNRSNCVMNVKRIEFNELVARTTTLPTKLSFVRTTGYVGGEDIITPTKLDSNYSDLASGCVCLTYPQSVTVTGSSFMDWLSYSNNSATGALSALATPLIGGNDFCLNNSKILSREFSETQPIVLRANQGFAITTGSISNMAYPVNITIHLNDGTNYYIIDKIMVLDSRPVLLSIFNTTGTGVSTLNITNVYISQIKDGSLLPLFTIESISGSYGGEDITPIKMDTNNTTIPSEVDIKKNATVTQGGPDSSHFSRKKIGGDLPFRRIAMPYFGKTPNLANGILNVRNRMIVFDFSTSIDADGGIVLREGEGIALLQRVNASAWGNFECVVHFTNTYTPPSGGGEHSYTFIG